MESDPQNIRPAKTTAASDPTAAKGRSRVEGEAPPPFPPDFELPDLRALLPVRPPFPACALGEGRRAGPELLDLLVFTCAARLGATKVYLNCI